MNRKNHMLNYNSVFTLKVYNQGKTFDHTNLLHIILYIIYRYYTK